MSNEKNPIFLVTGVFLVLAAFFVISNFILTKTYVDAWTTKWNMSALFIAALSLGGIGLISASGIAKSGTLSVVGFIYTVLSIVVYGYFGYTQSIGLHNFWAFIGFAIFFVVIAGIGLICVQKE